MNSGCMYIDTKLMNAACHILRVFEEKQPSSIKEPVNGRQSESIKTRGRATKIRTVKFQQPVPTLNQANIKRKQSR